MSDDFNRRDARLECPYYEEGQVRWCGAQSIAYVPSIGEIARSCAGNFADCIHHDRMNAIAGPVPGSRYAAWSGTLAGR